MDLIIYHNGCPDGFCAAYVAKQRYPEAQLMARDHGLEPPYDEVKGKDVLVVDFSWRTREQNLELAELSKSFRILDHHKTAQATLEGLGFATFDMTRSGAGLAWDYLFGKDAHEKIGSMYIPPSPRRWFVDYVEDRDLWRNNGQGTLPNSKAVNAYIMTLPFTLEAWEELKWIDTETAARLGTGALAHVAHYVREGVKQAQTGDLFFVDAVGFVHKYTVRIVNALYMNISELAGALSEEQGIDIGMGWFERGDGRMQFSLRNHTGAVDVSQIAQAKGGGGHKAAAGFTLSIDEGRMLIDAILGRKSTDSDKVFYAPMKVLDKQN
jgi:oligoribonuclease NrnB/cAMP/cGMP phosphodiesterase (DHH superfamily)